MIKSMTGYGEANGLINGQDYAVEIKAVKQSLHANSHSLAGNGFIP